MIDRSDAPASLPSRSQERKLSGEFRRVRAPATAYRFDSAGLVRRYASVRGWRGRTPENVVILFSCGIQLNDTHPFMAVAELMRILVDDVHLGGDQA